MLYAIYALDNPASAEKRLAARPAHVARLKLLQEQGRLLLAGPMPSADKADAPACGSLIVAEFASQQAAQQWMQDDPYVAAGVYAKAEVRPFLKLLP